MKRDEVSLALFDLQKIMSEKADGAIVRAEHIVAAHSGVLYRQIQGPKKERDQRVLKTSWKMILAHREHHFVNQWLKKNARGIVEFLKKEGH